MAEIGFAPGVAAQAALVAELRWRVFRNSLRTWRGQLELLSRILLGALAGLAAVGIGLGLGAAAYMSVAKGKPQFLVLLMWVVFGCWQVFPVLLAAATVEFDFRNLLCFPLRFSSFFLLSLCYALFDPAAMTALTWLVCIAAGILFARPEMLPWTILVLAVFAGGNLLLNRLILSWLERLLARRRTREALFIVLVLGAVSSQLFVALGQRWGRRAEPFVRGAVAAARLLPPGLAGEALTGAARGNTPTASSSAALLLAYGLGFGLLLRRRLHAEYLGEDLGESRAPSAARADRAVESAWQLPGLSGPVAAVLEKELRYLFRIGPMIMTVVLPLIMVAFFALLASAPRQRSGLFPRAPELLFPAAVAYAFLILAPQAHNSFAFDGRGIQLLLAAPVRFRDVLLAKNLAQGLLILCEAGVIGVLLGLLSVPPRARLGEVMAATFAALLFAMLVHFTAGNWLSLYFPRAFDFKRFSQRAPGITILAGLGLQAVVLGSAGGIFFLAGRLGRLWLGTVIFLALSAVALRVYVWMLERCSEIAAKRSEVLLNELCR